MAGPLERTLKREADLITGLYVKLDTYTELPHDQPYKVELKALMKDATRDDPETEAKAIRAFNAIVKRLSNCDGIEVIEGAILSEGEFTLSDLRQFPKWDLDYISMAEQQDTPADSAL